MEQRKSRRFVLQLPLAVTRAGAERTFLSGYTRNISSSGVLFTADEPPDLRCTIEYVVTLASGEPEPVSIRCVGKVVRCGQDPDARFQVAATLERYEFLRPEQEPAPVSAETRSS